MPTKKPRPVALSPRQVAEALSMSRRQIYRWIQNGDLETKRIDSTHRVFESQLAEKIGEKEAAQVFDAFATENGSA